jgi:uncharacterized protein
MVQQESIKIDFNVAVKMRDGVTLYADIYRPDDKGKYPAILGRLPYKDVFFSNAQGFKDVQRMARAGYAVVMHDCRGSGVSEGEFYPQRLDPQDGYDAVEWVAAQPWCDGNVGMYGGSYFGHTQWLAAITQPPHLKTIIPMICSIHRGAPFLKSNVFCMELIRAYLMWLAHALVKNKVTPERLHSLENQLSYFADHIQDQYYVLPLKDVPVAKVVEECSGASFYTDVLAHIDDGEYWQQLHSPIPIEKVTVPAFHISGWFDPHVSGVLASYINLRDKGGSEISRKNRVIIGPWVHSFLFESKVGVLDFGNSSSGASIDLTGMQIRWYDYWLKGIENGIPNEPPVRFFVMGDNVWRNENEWPLARTRYTKYYFHSEGHANGRFGDGVLDTNLPNAEQNDIYLYDPKNPVPTLGGVRDFNDRTTGVGDQRKIEERADVLVYTSAPLETDLEVTGPILVKLWAESSAVDTDFTGKLVDMWPDGPVYNLTEGIVRARYRESFSEAKLIESGKIYEYTIELGATSNVFKAGHRIRLEISSSNFPWYDRNLNTGRPLGQDAEMRVAIQTIYHKAQFPSHIMLPVIPR